MNTNEFFIDFFEVRLRFFIQERANLLQLITYFIQLRLRQRDREQAYILCKSF